MIQPYTDQSITNLKKAQGQINHVLTMIEEGGYCIDIIQQVNAALGLLKKTNNYILESHLLSCGTTKLSSGSQKSKEDFAKELVRVCNVAGR